MSIVSDPDGSCGTIRDEVTTAVRESRRSVVVLPW
jgi:hypothetical protein